MDLTDIFSSTGEAAFGVTEKGTILFWNRAAEALLGYRPDQVLGKSCFGLLGGRDIFGNLFCDRDCNPRKMIRQGRPVRRFELELRRRGGDYVRAAVTVLSFPGARPGEFTLLHLVHPAARPADREPATGREAVTREPGASAGRPGFGHRPLPRLTAREMEVLRRVAAGVGNREIAEALFISVATVRTHIENILKKLRVHSKLEAVSVAHREKLWF